MILRRDLFVGGVDDATALVHSLVLTFQSWPVRPLAAPLVPQLVIVLVWGQ